ncbi:hypothetical protein ACNQF7_06930 [Flavobacterium sp. RSP29]|uniref:hypothetical protein n=1 Tax=Flavobacterium sp. RSP29 TaxID=3401731 RepID=UPI003AB0A200
MLEQYQIYQKLSMWGVPIFTILAVVCGFFWNHYGLKIKEIEKQSKPQIEKTNSKTINTFQIKGDYIKGDKKETKSEIINAPSALIVTNRQSGGQNTVNYYQNEFKVPNVDIDNSIYSNIQDLITQYPNHPSTVIEIESGNSQRNKVAIQLETYLKEQHLGQYPKGNTYMGRFPDYPVTLFFNPENKQYVEALIKSIKPYLKTEYHLEETPSFPNNHIRLYINGQPLFETSGKVTIK